MLGEDLARLRLNDRNHVNRFNKILVLGVFFWREDAFVGLLSQHVDVGLQFRSARRSMSLRAKAGVNASVTGSRKRLR